jgi:hypothetical protein
MSKLVVDDPSTVARFDALEGRAEVCDSSGRVLGLFVPYSTKPMVSYRGAKSPYSKEELDRIYREEAKDAKPLSELWKKLREKFPHEFE